MNGLDIHLLNGLLISKQFYRDMLCACNGIYICMYVCITNYIFRGFVCLKMGMSLPSSEPPLVCWRIFYVFFFFNGDMISNLWMKMDINAIRMGFHLFDYFFLKVQNHASLTIDG